MVKIVIESPGCFRGAITLETKDIVFKKVIAPLPGDKLVLEVPVDDDLEYFQMSKDVKMSMSDEKNRNR